MHSAIQDPTSTNELRLKTGITKRFAQGFILLLVQALILLLGTGQLLWLWAWLYLGPCFARMIINGPILLRSSPETIAERGHAGFTQKWDKIISVFSIYRLTAGSFVQTRKLLLLR